MCRAIPSHGSPLALGRIIKPVVANITTQNTEMLTRTKIILVAVLFTLFGGVILMESILHLYSMPLTGWQRPLWLISFLVTSLALIAIPVYTSIRMRKTRAIDIACYLTLFIAWIGYPFGMHFYCEFSNSNRSDSCRWEGKGGTYYFIDSQHSDSFSGLIELYPPFFSFPKSKYTEIK